jgi:hypothetical protein
MKEKKPDRQSTTNSAEENLRRLIAKGLQADEMFRVVVEIPRK